VYSYPNPNVCNTWETPYCIPMNEHNANYNASNRGSWQYGCAECRSTCDCPIGKYCQILYSEREDFGKCVSYKEKLNKPCDGNLNSIPNSTNRDPFYGDTMLCAVYINFKDRKLNSTVRLSVWNGTCINGKCRECNSYLMYTPWHTTELWYTSSAQIMDENRRLECLWSGGERSIYANAPYKHRPRRCDGFSWKYENGIAVAAPAALLLVASAVLAF